MLSLASSAPASSMFGTPPIDEGIELDETSDYFAEEGNSAKRRKVSFLSFLRYSEESYRNLYQKTAPHPRKCFFQEARKLVHVSYLCSLHH